MPHSIGEKPMTSSKYKALESRFLRAADLPVGARYRVRIVDIVPDIVGPEEKEKDTLVFVGVPGGLQLPEVKPYVLNATNSRTLQELFPPDPAACRGQEVVLRVGLTNFPVPGTHTIIIEPAPAAPAVAVAPASPAQQPPTPAAPEPAQPAAAPKRGRGRPSTKPASAAPPDGAAAKGLDDEIPW
jgi:hypothetical protein